MLSVVMLGITESDNFGSKDIRLSKEYAVIRPFELHCVLYFRSIK